MSTDDLEARLEGAFSDQEAKNLLDLVRIAEMAERYDDMCYFVKKLVHKKMGASEPLSVEERNLLSVAYKNVVGSKRASWRTLGPDQEDSDPELVEKYKKIVEAELDDRCKDILKLLDDHLIPNVKGKNDETEVFYLKMAGDYYRYLCEFSSDESNVENARKYYQMAWDVASVHLVETHPTRLGLALNFSVCYYEILKSSTDACRLAKDAFDQAIDKLDDIEDASYKDATLIMQLLRDNLTLWTSEQGDEDEAEA